MNLRSQTALLILLITASCDQRWPLGGDGWPPPPQPVAVSQAVARSPAGGWLQLKFFGNNRFELWDNKAPARLSIHSGTFSVKYDTLKLHYDTLKPAYTGHTYIFDGNSLLGADVKTDLHYDTNFRSSYDFQGTQIYPFYRPLPDISKLYGRWYHQDRDSIHFTLTEHYWLSEDSYVRKLDTTRISLVYHSPPNIQDRYIAPFLYCLRPAGNRYYDQVLIVNDTMLYLKRFYNDGCATTHQRSAGYRRAHSLVPFTDERGHDRNKN